MQMIERVIRTLDHVTGRQPVLSGKGWQAHCPAHDDRHPSLSIAEGDDGRVLLTCHAGCPVEAIAEALSLTVADLMPEQGPRSSLRNGTGRRFPPGESATHPPDVRVFESLKAALAGLVGKLGGPSALWVYKDGHSEPVGVVARWDTDDGKVIRPLARTGTGWVIGAMPEPRPLYRLGELRDVLEDNPDQVVLVVEGEKACEAARGLGFVATTSSGGSGAPGKTDWTPLRGRTVTIWPDRDAAGQKYAQAVAEMLLRLDPPALVRIIEPPAELPQGGDVVDYAELHGDQTAARVQELIDAATPVEPAAPEAPARAPHLLCAADVEPTAVNWLWPGRIPLGRVTVLAGRPGGGKSFLTAYLAANVSLGRSWPDGSACLQGSVVMIAAEDDPADTIAPRLIAHGADRGRVHLLQGVIERDEDGKRVERVFTLADVATLRQTLEQLPECRLVIVDPIGSYLGGRTDAYRDNEVRAVLAPAAQLAAQYGAAVVVVAHTRKAVAGHADDTVLGSRAFTGLARSVLHLRMDPDDPDERRRLLLPGKANLCEPPPGLAFTIDKDEDGNGPCIHWSPEAVTVTADELACRDSRVSSEQSEVNRARDWLRETLRGGPMLTKEVEELARETEGFSPRTLRRAKRPADVESYRPANPGPWYFRLREPEAGGQWAAD